MADANALVNALALSGSADPSDLIRTQLQAQQQQALAQALMTQGLTPMSGTQSVGGVAIRTSPMEGAAKLAALLSGQSMQGQANDKSIQAALGQGQAMRAMFGLGDPAQAPQQPQQGGQPGMPPQGSQAGPLSVAGASPMTNMLSYSTDPAQHMKAVMEQYAATPEMKQAAAAYGVGSPKYVEALQAVVAKAGYRPPVRMQPGGGVMDADNKITTMPSAAPPGYQNVQDASGNWVAMPVRAGLSAVQGSTAAKGLGEAETTPSVAFDENGNPIFSTRLQDLLRAKGWQPPTTGQAPSGHATVVDTPDTIRAQIEAVRSNGGQPIEPKDQPAIDREVQRLEAKLSGGTVRPQQKPGVVAGANTAAEKAQSDLDTRFAGLRSTVAGAQTTNSYLDEIERLAPAAATGRFSDKLSLVNSLIAPFSSEKADAVTANNLLDKYSNQIVARLGSGDGKGGGMGTDAARAILQSAYPNSTMNVPAIKEAAASIRSVNAMQQAKLSFLSPQGNARDPVAYQEREQKFDTMADPRVFQLANMPAAEASAFLAKQSPAVQADLRRRAAALKQMGVF